jgi:hypothetical protein
LRQLFLPNPARAATRTREIFQQKKSALGKNNCRKIYAITAPLYLDLSTIDKKIIAPTMYLMILKQALRNVFLARPKSGKKRPGRTARYGKKFLLDKIGIQKNPAGI